MPNFFKRNNRLIYILFALVAVFIFGKILLVGIKYSPVLFQLIVNKEVSLKKSNDSVNVLLLGIGGGKHEGPNLSDTMIFASIDQDKNRIALVSIPRDLWVPDLNARVNAAYAEGEEKRAGGGLVLAKAAVSKILGQRIDYSARVDFAGFVQAVTLIGGIDVDVERVLDDYAYPIEGKEKDSCGRSEEEIKTFTATQSAEEKLSEFFLCRYKHIHFDKGKIHMNGESALQFVRSRHALGEEGSDFARSMRQEKVIKAFKDKVLSLGTLLNPAKVLGLYDILQQSIDTDVEQGELDDFIRLAQEMRTAKIKSVVLDTGDELTGRAGLLINPPPEEHYDFAWMLTPRIGNGNFTEIQKYVECEIKIGNCKITPTSISQ